MTDQSHQTIPLDQGLTDQATAAEASLRALITPLAEALQRAKVVRDEIDGVSFARYQAGTKDADDVYEEIPGLRAMLDVAGEIVELVEDYERVSPGKVD